jgi:hypothetical protein
MAITNYDSIIASRGAGKDDDVFFFKSAQAGATVTANWYNFIKTAGSPSSAVTYAAASAAGSLMTSTMAGGIPLRATTGDDKYLLTFAGGVVGGAEIGVLGLIDVLWAGAGIQIGSSATIAINSSAITRSTQWNKHCLGVMISTALTTASTMTIWYTDAGGTATLVNLPLPIAGSAGNMRPAGQLAVTLPNGIQSIQSAQVQTAQTAGAVDLFIFKPLVFIPTVALNTWVERDMTAQIDGILKLDDDAAFTPGFLCVVALTNGTTARGIIGQIRTCAG